MTNHVDDKDGILEKITLTVLRAGSSHMAVSWGGGGGGRERHGGVTDATATCQ